MYKIILENIINSLKSIASNKLRSILSMLGIIIGVSSVIILTAIGNGSQQSIINSIEEMGTNTLTISAGGFGGSKEKNSGKDFLDNGLKEKIEEKIEGIDNVIPIVSGNGTAKYGGNDLSVSISGVSQNFIESNNIEVLSGNNFSEDHIINLDKVAILGYNTNEELFGSENAIGNKIKVGKNIFTVIGTIEENNNYDSSIFIPITTAQIRIMGQKYYSELKIIVSDSDKVSDKEDELDSLLRSHLGLSESDLATFRIRNQADMLKNLTSITSTLTILLSGIAGISLVVGGIGVMNIMLVSVTERTKEIGIRKAIGAGKIDIILQFLTEASMLSLIGGIVGIIFSFLSVEVINKLGLLSIITLDSIILSFGFSVLIGLIFGLLPAIKASKLRPIDALRFE